MADTSQSEQPSQASEPQTNGLPDGVEEDEKAKMRPADIDADMREMERRKRVEMIMNSRLFREELERIIECQLKDGNGPAGLLQQISDMMGMQGGRLQSGNVFRSASCVVPINDIRGVESMGYAKGEKILRCKLAAVYRLMDLYGWSQGVHNHITARLNQDQEHFLVNPFGMLYHEITASSLVKIDMQGNIVESGTTNFGVNVTGFMLHAAIHAARPDIKCIIHVHTPSVLAVSSLKCGLLPLCQEAVVVGEISQHPYLGCLSEPEEREKIARNLGPLNKVMFLTNHGVVCCGETVEEAFFNVYNTVLACETQIKLMPMGVDNLVLVSDEARKQIYEAARRPPDSATKQPDPADLPPSGIKKEKQWRVGGIEFEALMRMLDNAGFRTGYIYRHPLVKGEPPRPRNDVEVPPAVSSLGYLLEEEEMYRQGHWKKYADGRKTHDRTRWLNSPNVYQKVEILETGTPDPKKITKWVDANAEEWVAEGSPTHSSTPVKIESALQFVPKNTDPKEFKKLQQQIKDNRRSDKITSGPQSHILEGVSWEEAKKLQDANISATGDQVILVGAASKGIIQRGFQHNALVYKTPYAKNPFDTITDEELEEYKKVVERKQRGESFDEEQSESEPLSSSLHNSRPTNEESVSALKSPFMSPTSAASETEEESREEPRVLRIETKQVPRPSQAEVVLSDAEGELPDPGVERTMSLRYPARAPDSPADPEQFKRTWSLPPDQLKKKDGSEILTTESCGCQKNLPLHQEHCVYPNNKHLTSCSCNALVKVHNISESSFLPLCSFPLKNPLVVSSHYNSYFPVVSSVSRKKKVNKNLNTVGCHITRFANIPHLQRKEEIDEIWASRVERLFSEDLDIRADHKIVCCETADQHDSDENEDLKSKAFVDMSINNFGNNPVVKFNASKETIELENYLHYSKLHLVENKGGLGTFGSQVYFQDLSGQFENFQREENILNIYRRGKSTFTENVERGRYENYEIDIGSINKAIIYDQYYRKKTKMRGLKRDENNFRLRDADVHHTLSSLTLSKFVSDLKCVFHSELMFSSKRFFELPAQVNFYGSTAMSCLCNLGKCFFCCSSFPSVENEDPEPFLSVSSKRNLPANPCPVQCKTLCLSTSPITFVKTIIPHHVNIKLTQVHCSSERNIFLNAVQLNENERVTWESNEDNDIDDFFIAQLANNSCNKMKQNHHMFTLNIVGSSGIKGDIRIILHRLHLPDSFIAENGIFCCFAENFNDFFKNFPYLEMNNVLKVATEVDGSTFEDHKSTSKISIAKTLNENEMATSVTIVYNPQNDWNSDSRNYCVLYANKAESYIVCDSYVHCDFINLNHLINYLVNKCKSSDYGIIGLSNSYRNENLMNSLMKDIHFYFSSIWDENYNVNLQQNSPSSSNSVLKAFMAMRYCQDTNDVTEMLVTNITPKEVNLKNDQETPDNLTVAQYLTNNSVNQHNFCLEPNMTSGFESLKICYICKSNGKGTSSKIAPRTSPSKKIVRKGSFVDIMKVACFYHRRQLSSSTNIILSMKCISSLISSTSQWIGLDYDVHFLSSCKMRFLESKSDTGMKICHKQTKEDKYSVLENKVLVDSIFKFLYSQSVNENDSINTAIKEELSNIPSKSHLNRYYQQESPANFSVYNMVRSFVAENTKSLNDVIISSLEIGDLLSFGSPEIRLNLYMKPDFQTLIRHNQLFGTKILDYNIYDQNLDNDENIMNIVCTYLEVKKNFPMMSNIKTLFFNPAREIKDESDYLCEVFNALNMYCTNEESDNILSNLPFKLHGNIFKEAITSRNLDVAKVFLFWTNLYHSDQNLPVLSRELRANNLSIYCDQEKECLPCGFNGGIHVFNTLPVSFNLLRKVLTSPVICSEYCECELKNRIITYKSWNENAGQKCFNALKVEVSQNSFPELLKREEISFRNGDFGSSMDYLALRRKKYSFDLKSSNDQNKNRLDSLWSMKLFFLGNLNRELKLKLEELYVPSESLLHFELNSSQIAKMKREENYYFSDSKNEQMRICPEIIESKTSANFDNESTTTSSELTESKCTVVPNQELDRTYSISSHCSCDSQCSSDFLGSIDSDISMSTTSLDIVTQLTEAPSITPDQSLDFYSFSSPVLDMEDPYLSLSDIPESHNCTPSDSESLNMSSDISFAMQELEPAEYSDKCGYQQSCNSQKSEFGLSPYLKICFSSSESISSGTALNYSTSGVCSSCGSFSPVPVTGTEYVRPTSALSFSPYSSRTSSPYENVPEMLEIHICAECKLNMGTNETLPSNPLSDRNNEGSMQISTNIHFDANAKWKDNVNMLPVSLRNGEMQLRGECRLSLSFTPCQDEVHNSKASCGGDHSSQVVLNCSTDQEEECHLLSVKNGVVGYKSRKKKLRSQVQSEEDIYLSGGYQSGAFPMKRIKIDTCKNQNVSKVEESADSKTEFASHSKSKSDCTYGKENMFSDKSGNQRLGVKSQSWQDLSMRKSSVSYATNKKVHNPGKICHRPDNTFHKNCIVGNKTMTKSYSYNSLLLDQPKYKSCRSTRCRTYDTFLIDGEHIFAMLTPENSRSPKKNNHYDSKAPQILSEQPDELIVGSFELDSSKFTEYIDSLNFSPINLPHANGSDISSISSLPTDRVPISDIESPAVPKQKACNDSHCVDCNDFLCTNDL